MEIWKDIVGYEGLYQVSNMGRVKSLARYKRNGTKKNGEPMMYLLNEEIKVLQIDKAGYQNVYLWKDNKMKFVKVHRLVAQAFIPNPNNYPLVMHMDNNPTNNLPSNLQWGTQKHNMQHASQCGRIRNQFS
jgi:hypothetical protein